MPFDGVFTYCMINELSFLNEGKIEKIQQPSRDEIVLFVRKERKNHRLLISINPSCARICITNINRESPDTPPNFCIVLRKFMSGGIIKEFKQDELDRIINIHFEKKDELGYVGNYILSIEIMGKHSNILLINSDNIIIDSMKHIGRGMNRYREILPNALYIVPPKANKINPLNVNSQRVYELLDTNRDKKIVEFFTDNFLGISFPLSEQICSVLKSKKISEMNSDELNEVISNFFFYIIKVKNKDIKPIIFYDDYTMKDFYVFNLNKYELFKREYFESLSELLDLFYSKTDIKLNLKHKYSDIFKLINNTIDKISKKLQIYTNKINECIDYERWRIYGDLILANQYKIAPNSESTVLENFYEDNREIKIDLDPNLSPPENAVSYYGRYNKEKKTIENLNKQIAESNSDMLYLESVLVNLENASDVNTIEEIKLELIDSGYIRKKKRPILKKFKSTPMHFISSDGFDIYVGKNNSQNDYLTFKFAVSSDLWMHTKDFPGSHVIIKSKKGSISDTALLEGAYLSAYFSKGKNSSMVPVDYTERKNVKKPSGAKPGMVIYYTNKTIYVNPMDEKIKKILEKQRESF